MITKNLKQLINLPEINLLFSIFSSSIDNKEKGIYLVGGCIRDALQEKNIKDIDFATPHNPEEVINLLTQNNIKYYDIGIDFGTVTALINDKKYEITSFRKDFETDGRHTLVKYTKNIEIDASRRDFTINAIYCDEDEKLYDFFNGIDDLQNKKLVFIGEPKKRIQEDYLRILRFFRFISIFSNYSIDELTLDCISKESSHLKSISKERLWSEFSKILSQYDPLPAIKLMEKTGIFKCIFDNIKSSNCFTSLINIEKKLDTTASYIRRLSVLLCNSVEEINKFNDTYPLTSNDKKSLIQLSKIDPKIVSYLSIKEARVKLYRLGMKAFQDQVIINWANDSNIKNEINWRALFEVAKSFEKPQFPFNAKDVINMGIEEGPLVGKILLELEDWWVDNGFLTDEYSIIERLKAICLSHK
tara:strand:- start:208 stop:1455 length:1248 start_codon:yes stop_codon:yes gene_type:complete